MKHNIILADENKKRAILTLNSLWYYPDITRTDQKLSKINTTSHLKINVYSFSHVLFISNTMGFFIHLLGRNRRLTVHQCYTTFSVIGYNVKKAKCYLVISSITMFYRRIFPSKIKDRIMQVDMVDFSKEKSTVCLKVE